MKYEWTLSYIKLLIRKWKKKKKSPETLSLISCHYGWYCPSENDIDFLSLSRTSSRHLQRPKWPGPWQPLGPHSLPSFPSLILVSSPSISETLFITRMSHYHKEPSWATLSKIHLPVTLYALYTELIFFIAVTLYLIFVHFAQLNEEAS